jgi:hypothetical protein
MTNKELKKAFRDMQEEVNNLPRSAEPLPEDEVRRRELILLKQVILRKIADAKKQKERQKELFNIGLYGLITSFLESYR